MQFDFKVEQVAELLPRVNGLLWHDAMQRVLPKWNIDTIDRVAGFIAQTSHESAGYSVLTENLNYSASALDKIFPKYFKRAGRDAKDYHRQPEKIANVIYANRMDNGDTDSGDGWRFRGGGILQLTGRYNYTQFGKAEDKTAEEATEFVRSPIGALASACWFWDTNNINKYCDAQDITGMTKRINGGTIGLEDRKKHYAHALEVLGGHYTPRETYETVRLGSKGPTVVKLQETLGLTADGIFGKGTEAKLKGWQSLRGLTPDGIAGPNTLGILFND
ncbi:peptidoglycan-binding protein [bacterium]|jgi:putative chitinase|nr:peptidoglycan-binding protein [bacterium]